MGPQRHNFEGVSDQVGEVPRYALGLDEMDALIRTIIDVTTINPRWITETIFPGDGREYLYKENKVWTEEPPSEEER